MSTPQPQPSPDNQKAQQPKLTIDEQVSLMLAHLNRAVNTVSKEAESALIKVVQQLLKVQQDYAKLSEEYTQYKVSHPDITKVEPTHTSQNNPPPANTTP